MLIRLLKTFLGRYKTELAMVLLLQTLQTLASLYLPTLNASLIDKGVLHTVGGVLHPDNGYIHRTGLIMLGVTLFQVVCATGAVYFGSKAAMGFGRDVAIVFSASSPAGLIRIDDHG